MEVTFFNIALVITICSYIYLAYFIVKERIYKDFGLFDLVIFLLGPIGVLFILLMGYISYNDDDEL